MLGEYPIPYDEDKKDNIGIIFLGLFRMLLIRSIDYSYAFFTKYLIVRLHRAKLSQLHNVLDISTRTRI